MIILGQSGLSSLPCLGVAQINDARMASLWNGMRPLFWPQTEGPPAHVWNAEAVPTPEDSSQATINKIRGLVCMPCRIVVPLISVAMFVGGRGSAEQFRALAGRESSC